MSQREEIDLIPIAWDGPGGLETPTTVEHIDTIIHWKAAEVIAKLDQSALERLVSRIPGSYRKIRRRWVIRSWQNLLIFFHERESDKRWVVRIPYKQEDKHFLEDEVLPLKRVSRMFPNFRKPTLYRWGLASDPDNEIGFNYMLLDFIDGTQMPSWTEDFPCIEQKERLLAQLCDIHIQILTRPVKHSDLIGHGMFPTQPCLLPPEITTAKYMFGLVDESINKLFDLFASTQCWPSREDVRDLFGLLMLRSQVQDYVVIQYNDSPFVISHPDLHDRNIIVSGTLHGSDNDLLASTTTPAKKSWTRRLGETLAPHPTKVFAPAEDELGVNIAGIVDWDEAQPVPLQVATIYPKFLDTAPGGGFPNLAQDYRPPDTTQDKALFVKLLAEREKKATGHTFISELLADGSEERNFFTKSLSYKCIRDHWMMRHRRAFHDGAIVQADLADAQVGWGGYLHEHQQQQKRKAKLKISASGWSWICVFMTLQLDEMEKYSTDTSWYLPAHVY